MPFVRGDEISLDSGLTWPTYKGQLRCINQDLPYEIECHLCEGMRSH